MKILTKEQQESSEDVKIRSIRKEKLICKNRKYKVRNQCHYKKGISRCLTYHM